jgi:hypothetical protein
MIIWIVPLSVSPHRTCISTCLIWVLLGAHGSILQHMVHNHVPFLKRENFWSLKYTCQYLPDYHLSASAILYPFGLVQNEAVMGVKEINTGFTVLIPTLGTRMPELASQFSHSLLAVWLQSPSSYHPWWAEVTSLPAFPQMVSSTGRGLAMCQAHCSSHSINEHGAPGQCKMQPRCSGMVLAWGSSGGIGLSLIFFLLRSDKYY